MPELTAHAASEMPLALDPPPLAAVAAGASGWESARKLDLIQAAAPSQTTWLHSPSVAPWTS